MRIQPRSIICDYPGLVNVIITKVKIATAFDPKATLSPPPHLEFNAIWDTGATNTAISQNVISQCGLIPTGMQRVTNAHRETKPCNAFLVNIMLPQGVGVSEIRVTEGKFGDRIDALIGMDIIGRGDFAISNFNDKTTFSFRIPSMERVELKSSKIITQTRITGRNDLCPCGSGKKYKKCHWDGRS